MTLESRTNLSCRPLETGVNLPVARRKFQAAGLLLRTTQDSRSDSVMNTTRVRKAFKYPSDDDGTDVSHDELDEQGEHCNLFSSYICTTTPPGKCLLLNNDVRILQHASPALVQYTAKAGSHHRHHHPPPLVWRSSLPCVRGHR